MLITINTDLILNTEIIHKVLHVADESPTPSTYVSFQDIDGAIATIREDDPIKELFNLIANVDKYDDAVDFDPDMEM